MASLPSNTFMFNYNAREYNSSTRTFPKTKGQLFGEDLILQGSPRAVYEDHLDMGNDSAYMGKQYSTAASNPFNRNSSNNSFTFIYKTSGFTSGSNNLFGNRDDFYNYMVRGNMFHTQQSGFLNLTPSTYPEICLIRIYADGKSERKFLDSSGNVLKSTSASTISWGNQSKGFAFFAGYRDGGEKFNSTFYWMYCSLETLTDDEVKKVIAYNENITTFETDITAITATYETTTSSVTLTAAEDMAWTASTLNDWITLSTTGGTGSSVFTVTLSKNKAYSARNGLVTLTNGEDVIEITVEQAKHPLLIPNENIYRADLEVIKGYRSGSTINKAYRSGELIYYKLDYPQPTPPGPGPEETPLTFNILSAGTIYWRAENTAFTRTIEYKKNDGEWTTITSTTGGTSISVNAGDVVQFRGNNATYSPSSSMYNSFSDSTAKFEVEGNIMSLIDSENFATATTLASSDTFDCLFIHCTGLTSAENLVLPATTLANYCYYCMFWGCTSLTSAPVLPATTLAFGCYGSMFNGCTSLTSAPALPATTLAGGCYSNMFADCTSLTTAPELPATILASYCYYGMFNRCTNLNYIKCLAADISATNYTATWVGGVSSTGTFVTPSSTNWTTGDSGIPSGWTRVDA